MTITKDLTKEPFEYQNGYHIIKRHADGTVTVAFYEADSDFWWDEERVDQAELQ